MCKKDRASGSFFFNLSKPQMQSILAKFLQTKERALPTPLHQGKHQKRKPAPMSARTVELVMLAGLAIEGS